MCSVCPVSGKRDQAVADALQLIIGCELRMRMQEGRDVARVERDPVSWLGDPDSRNHPEDIGELDVHATAGRAPLIHLDCHAILNLGYSIEHAEDLANR
jgi:hypothetical protein